MGITFKIRNQTTYHLDRDSYFSRAFEQHFSFRHKQNVKSILNFLARACVFQAPNWAYSHCWLPRFGFTLYGQQFASGMSAWIYTCQVNMISFLCDSIYNKAEILNQPPCLHHYRLSLHSFMSFNFTSGNFQIFKNLNLNYNITLRLLVETNKQDMFSWVSVNVQIFQTFNSDTHTCFWS